MRDLVNETKSRKINAEKRKIKYELTPLTLMKIYNTPRCFYLNIPLNVRHANFKEDTKITLDRINNDIGYIKTNVAASSNIANRLKSLVEGGLITPEDVIECGNKLKKIFSQC